MILTVFRIIPLGISSIKNLQRMVPEFLTAFIVVPVVNVEIRLDE